MATVQHQEEHPYRAQHIQRRSGNSRLRVEGDNGPIRSTYDVSNTSTQLILLNNRYSKDVNRLRGQSARSRSIVVPDPIRHFLSESPIDRKTHEQCFNTTNSSLSHYSDMDNNHRYRFTQGYIPVNTNRHAACAGPRPINIERPKKRHRMLSEKTLSKSVAYCPDLTRGEKLYLYNISRVYSTKNMQAINQRKYATVLSQEEQTGRYNQRDINKYWNYIRSPRQTNWGSGKSSFTPKRTKSAPPGKQRTRKVERPKTRMEGRELSDVESRDTPRGTQEDQPSKKEKGIIATVLAEAEDHKSETGSHHSRGSKNSNNSKTGPRRSSSRSLSSSSSRSRSSSSSSSFSHRSSSSDTEIKHKRASDGETTVQRAKDESQNFESDTQVSRATDNEMSGRPDARASDTDNEDTSRGKKEAYSSMSDSRGNDSQFREGHGRPKSRFGRKDAHKDDDVDSDSLSFTSKSSSSIDKSKSVNQKKTSKMPLDKIEEKTKIIIGTNANTKETNQQRECDSSVSESKDYSQITTTTDNSTSVSHKNESETSQKAAESKKKITKSRYIESRRTRTNSESSLTQSISSNKSSDKKQRKSSRTSLKSNGSIKSIPKAERGKREKTEITTKLENVIEDGEQVKSRKTYRSISLESQLKTDLPSNEKDVDKIEY